MGKMFESLTDKDVVSDTAPQSTTANLIIASFSPFNPPSREHLYRRIATITILGLDTFVEVISIFPHGFSFSVIPLIVLAVFHFLCAVWLLHCIGRMVGERIVLNKVLVRRDFDVFLGGLVVVELVLVGGHFGGLTHNVAGAWWGLGIAELLALWGVGSVAWLGPLEMQ